VVRYLSYPSATLVDVTTLRFSPSAADLWAQCPKRWWYRYVDRLPEPPPGEPAVLGTFVHRILELLLADPADERTAERARVLARVAWAETEASEDWASLELDDAQALRFRQRAWATVEAYLAFGEPTKVRPVAQELEVLVDLDGVPFRGFIDLVEEGDAEGSVVITDYKTGKPPEAGKPWSDERAAAKLWQPQWYAAALAELGEHVPVKARLLFFTAEDDGPGKGFTHKTRELAVDVTDESNEVARAELRRRWDEITVAREAGSAESKPGPLCGWCPFVDVCADGRSECERRWGERNSFTGGRKLRADAPAVALLGLVDA